MDLAGDWVGAYIDPRYEDGVFPIRAKFELVGSRIKGTMIDERTVVTESLESVMGTVPLDSSDRPSWDLFLQRFPDAVLTTQLPIDSYLQGATRGNTISFNKDYVGSQEATWSAVGLKTVTETLKSLPIVYQGNLDATGTEIRGTWTVLEKSLGGLVSRAVASGEFWLKKAW
jgi:hypothetical protein